MKRRQLFGGMVDRRIETVQLDADVAGVLDEFGNVIELVDGDRELQQSERQQCKPRAAPPQAGSRQVVVFINQQ